MYTFNASNAWFLETYDLDSLRFTAENNWPDEPSMITEWLRAEGVIPPYVDVVREFSTYPVLDRKAIKAEHLASLAREWDKLGPSHLTDWLDMVELECGNSSKRDIVKESLEAVGEQLSS